MLLGDEECVLSPKSPVILTYVILPCTTERQNGTKVSPKRASLHSRATISAKSVALEWREEGFWNDQRSINGWFCSCQRQKRIRRWHYMEKMRPS